MARLASAGAGCQLKRASPLISLPIQTRSRKAKLRRIFHDKIPSRDLETLVPNGCSGWDGPPRTGSHPGGMPRLIPKSQIFWSIKPAHFPSGRKPEGGMGGSPVWTWAWQPHCLCLGVGHFENPSNGAPLRLGLGVGHFENPSNGAPYAWVHFENPQRGFIPQPRVARHEHPLGLLFHKTPQRGCLPIAWPTPYRVSRCNKIARAPWPVFFSGKARNRL